MRQELTIKPEGISARRKKMRLLRTEYEDQIAWAATHYHSLANQGMSAKKQLSQGQNIFFCFTLILLGVALLLTPISLAISLIALYTIFCFGILILRITLFYQAVHTPLHKPAPPPPPLPQGDLPIFTILLPLYRESSSLPHLVKSLARLNYPKEKLDIKVLLEESDHETQMSAQTYCKAPYYDLIIIPPGHPQTKPKACNIGLWSALGDYTVIYDAEDRPEPDQLLIAAAAFAQAGSETVCLQARLNYYNRQKNWLTRLFSLEYSLLFDILLPGLTKLDLPIPLGGTSNFFRTQTLLDIGGWDPFNVTEDADIGLRLYRAGGRVQMIASTTFEEAPSKIKDWLMQRSRWIKGYIQTWLVHSRRAGKSLSLPDLKFHIVLHLFIGSVAVASLINPIFWLLFWLWSSGLISFTHQLFPSPLMEISILALLMGNFLFIYLALVAPAIRRWYKVGLFALLLPAYWLLQSIAGYIALREIFTKPHYWQKTPHYPQTTAPAQTSRPAHITLVNIAAPTEPE